MKMVRWLFLLREVRLQGIPVPDAVVADTLGWILLGQGKQVEAMQFLLKAVSFDASNLEIRLHLAKALLKTGETSRAKSELNTIVSSGKGFPQLEEAKALLAQIGS